MDRDSVHDVVSEEVFAMRGVYFKLFLQGKIEGRVYLFEDRVRYISGIE